MTVRKYVELHYTFPHEAAAITVGLHNQDRGFDYPVHLFQNEGGLLASVTVEATTLTAADALSMAEDLAFEEIDNYAPADMDEDDIPDPWRILLVDHDGMADDLRNSKVLDWDGEKMRPEKPVDDEDGDGGERAPVMAGPSPKPSSTGA